MVGAIIRRRDTVLVARRSPERSAGGLWEFPGGKIETGETPEAALRRELQEELGVDVAVGPFVDRSLSDVGTARIELSCYAAQFTGEDPTTSSDHDAMQWVPLTELSSLQWAPGDVPLLEGLPERLATLRDESKAK